LFSNVFNDAYYPPEVSHWVGTGKILIELQFFSVEQVVVAIWPDSKLLWRDIREKFWPARTKTDIYSI